MGVLACSRYRCENIMCDRYSSNHGYICHECYEDLKAGGSQNIEAFMDSKKTTATYHDALAWETELNSEFRLNTY